MRKTIMHGSNRVATGWLPPSEKYEQTGKVNTLGLLVTVWVCLMSLFSFQGYAQGLELEWAIDAQGPHINRANGMARDAEGNVYFYGTFGDSLDIGSGAAFLPGSSMNDASQGDAFIIKYSAAGTFIWTKSLPGRFEGPLFGNSLVIDQAGNFIITGGFRDSADFDPGSGVAILISASASVSNSSLADFFLAKYDSDGNYIWAKNMGSGSDDRGSGVTMGANGDIYVTGGFKDTVDFDPGPGTAFLYSAGGPASDAFIAKYDMDGNYIWAHRMGGVGALGDNGYDVALDPEGNVYATGAFSGLATFSSTTATLAATGSSNIFLMKHDAEGNFLWAKSMGGSGGSTGHRVACDLNGGVYITGRFFLGQIDLDPGPDTALFAPVGLYATFLAKYDTGGNYTWANSIAGSGLINYAWGIGTDGIGNVYTCGQFTGTADFDPGPETVNLSSTAFGNTGSAGFVAKYDALTGGYIWAGTLDGQNSVGGCGGYGLDVDPSGTLYMTGYWGDSTDMDPGSGVVWHDALNPGNQVLLLKLSCGEADSTHLNIEECDSAYTLNGVTYTESGTYIQHLPNVYRCDSTIVLELTMQPMAAPVITVNEFILGTTEAYASYQWIKDGVPMPEETGAILLVTENGDYQVQVTNADGCQAISAIYTVDNVSVAEVDGIGSRIRVYPNPANEEIHISSPVAVNVALYSLDGRLMQYVTEPGSISIKGLAAGMYLLRITDKNGNLVKYAKVIKQAK